MTTPKARADGMTLQQAIDHLRGSASVLEGTTAILPAAVAIVLAQLAERDAVIERMRAVLQEVYDSIPATYDEKHPLVIRHAMALNAIPGALSALQPGDLA